MKSTKKKNRSRGCGLLLYLTENEKFILEQKTKLSGMRSQSAFLRHLILYGYVYDVDYSELRNYNTNLSRIANNLNQITKRINATNNVYKEDINEIKELMNKIWQSQKSMLSKQPYRKQ